MSDDFKHTHVYHPVGIDSFDPKTHPGSFAIQPGSPVKKHPGQFGKGKLAFVHIEDEHGNHQQVFKRSIVSKRQAMSSSDDSMRWDPKAGETEMANWEPLFNNRQGQRRA